MTGIYFLLPTLITIFVSFLVVRAGAIALMLTGLDRNRAVFQSLSAFSGTGFTTREAERVINHPGRRKIISILMVLGNAGIVTVIITATSSMVTSKGFRLPLNAFILLAGIYGIYRLATFKGFIRRWENFIEDRLIKSNVFEEGAVEDLLHLIEGYGLVRAIITKDSPVVGTHVSECRECGSEVVVLGIERGRDWIPIPGEEETLLEGDRLIVYGPLDALKTLFSQVEEQTP